MVMEPPTPPTPANDLVHCASTDCATPPFDPTDPPEGAVEIRGKRGSLYACCLSCAQVVLVYAAYAEAREPVFLGHLAPPEEHDRTLEREAALARVREAQAVIAANS